MSRLYFFSDGREEKFCLRHPGIVSTGKVEETQTSKTTPFFFAPINNKMYCWLQCYYSIPHRAALLNTSWQLQKQVSQDHPELDCANVQLRINLASMSLSLLNSSHCFYLACPISCLISPGIILTPVGWAGESHQSKNCWVFFAVLNATCVLYIGTHSHTPFREDYCPEESSKISFIFSTPTVNIRFQGH